MSRFVAALVIGFSLMMPVSLVCAQDHDQSMHHHEWNNAEKSHWQEWEKEHRKKDHDWDKASKKEQDHYWKWRDKQGWRS